MNLNKTPKNTWVFIIVLLAGIVVGGFLGDMLSSFPYLSWLNYGNDFGLESPVVLNLGIIKIQFALLIHFTISGVLGMIMAIFIYKKLI